MMTVVATLNIWMPRITSQTFHVTVVLYTCLSLCVSSTVLVCFKYFNDLTCTAIIISFCWCLGFLKYLHFCILFILCAVLDAYLFLDVCFRRIILSSGVHCNSSMTTGLFFTIVNSLLKTVLSPVFWLLWSVVIALSWHLLVFYIFKIVFSGGFLFPWTCWFSDIYNVSCYLHRALNLHYFKSHIYIFFYTCTFIIFIRVLGVDFFSSF